MGLHALQCTSMCQSKGTMQSVLLTYKLYVYLFGTAPQCLLHYPPHTLHELYQHWRNWGWQCQWTLAPGRTTHLQKCSCVTVWHCKCFMGHKGGIFCVPIVKWINGYSIPGLLSLWLTPFMCCLEWRNGNGNVATKWQTQPPHEGTIHKHKFKQESWR